MSARKPLAVGDRVTAGRGDDRDTGVIVAIDGDSVRVAWDSGVTTPADLRDCRRTTERWSGGERVS